MSLDTVATTKARAATSKTGKPRTPQYGRISAVHRDCSQDCSQATGRRPTHVDNSGMSAQRTDHGGRSWTTCPLLRIRCSPRQARRAAYARSACGIALAGTGRSSQAHLLRRSALPAAVFTALDCPPCGHRVLDRSARRRFVMISPAWTRHPLATDRRPSGGRERTEPAAPRIQGHRAGVMPGVPVAGETGVMRGTLQAREAKCRD